MSRTISLVAGTAVLSPANRKVNLIIPCNWYSLGSPSPATLQPNPSPIIGMETCTQASIFIPINTSYFIRLEQYSFIGMWVVSSI